MEQEQLDLNDPICAACETGGNMICCDGKCLRSFHPKCIGMKDEDIPDDCPFVCADCWNGIQRCFKCKYFDVEEDLVKCEVPYCGKFYHSKCMDNENGKNICNLHRCFDCKDQVLDYKKKKDLHKCFRCPKAFDLKHRPRDVHVLGNEYFLCIRHVNEEEQLPELGEDIQEKMALRKQNKDTSKRDSAGKSAIRKANRPVPVGARIPASPKPASGHILLPRINTRVAVRAPSTGSSQIASTGSSASPSAGEASITIARRKRPMVVQAERPASSPHYSSHGSDHNFQRDSPGSGWDGAHFGQPAGCESYSEYDSFSAPPQPYGGGRGSSMFFHGGGGHFLRETESCTYEDQYIEPHYDRFSPTDSFADSNRFNRRHDFRKRRRFGGFETEFDSGGGSSMSRTEEMLMYGMPAPYVPYTGRSDYIDDFVQPPPPPAYPRVDSNSSFGMGRTAALLAESPCLANNSAPRFPPGGEHPIKNVDHKSSKGSEIAPKPPAPAPEEKKIDPNDLFALLAANGLF